MEKGKQDLGPPSQGWAPFVRGRVLGESSLCVGEEFPACRGEQELWKEADSSSTESSTGICALVDSPYITVNLIKYIVIPIDGILISWDRKNHSPSFSEWKHLLSSAGKACPWLTGLPRGVLVGLCSPIPSCCVLLGRFQGWNSGDGPGHLGRERVPGQQRQGIDPLKAWEMTRWCGGHRSQDPGRCCSLWAPVCWRWDSLRITELTRCGENRSCHMQVDLKRLQLWVEVWVGYNLYKQVFPRMEK